MYNSGIIRKKARWGQNQSSCNVLLEKLKEFHSESRIVWVGVIWLGFVMLVILYGSYHGIHHHQGEPFGRICLELFPSIEESQIQVVGQCSNHVPLKIFKHQPDPCDGKNMTPVLEEKITSTGWSIHLRTPQPEMRVEMAGPAGPAGPVHAGALCQGFPLPIFYGGCCTRELHGFQGLFWVPLPNFQKV